MTKLIYAARTVGTTINDYRNVISSALDNVADNKEAQASINKICLKYISNANSRLLFTGVGKNSYLAQKLAATCQSLNIRASFFDAVNAMHGDLGNLLPGDILIAFSKSGTTAELLNMLSYIKQNSNTWSNEIYSVFAEYDNVNKTAKIRELSDACIPMPYLYELDDNSTVPTTSALLMQAIGDVIALHIASLQNLTTEQFGLTHPGGAIGAKHNSQIEPDCVYISFNNVVEHAIKQGHPNFVTIADITFTKENDELYIAATKTGLVQFDKNLHMLQVDSDGKGTIVNVL